MQSRSRLPERSKLHSYPSVTQPDNCSKISVGDGSVLKSALRRPSYLELFLLDDKTWTAAKFSPKS